MKKINYIYVGILSLILGISTTSCNDYLDINQDPNYVTEGTLSTLFPSAATTTISQLGYNGQIIGDMWMQITTQGNTTNQYNTTVGYNLTVSSYTGFWTNAYANTLPDLKFVMEIAEEEGAWNYWIMAKVLTAYNFHMLTDLYEDIPFTEALQAAEFPQPKYDDSRSVVYPGILAMLDEAIAKAADAKGGSNPVIGTVDFYFRGNIDKWISFAKSLKLKIYLRDFTTYRSDISNLLNAGGLLEENCAFTSFEDATNKGNPLYEYNIRQLNTQENMRACHTMLEFLMAHEDPRITEFYEITSFAQSAINNGEELTTREMYEGLPCGDRPSSSEGDAESVPLAKSSRYKQSYSDPVYLMNAAEAMFLQAEAWARLGENEKAKAAYEQGVKNAFARFNMDGTEFISGAYAFDSSSLEAMLISILTQKWVAAGKANSLDAVFDRNRTGIPALSTALTVRKSNQSPGLTDGYQLGTLVTPATTVLGPSDFPRRLLVPDVSSLYNTNAPSPKPIQEPMWWQVASGK